MFLAAKKSGSLCMQFVCCILFTELFGGRSGHHEEERHAQMEKSVGDNDMCRAATTKIQAIFRAAMQRRTVSEAAATVAIVVTEGFGDLIGRNDIRHVLNDLQMQKRRLEEKLREFSEVHNVENQIQIVKDWPLAMEPEVTYFNVSTREYTKRLTKIEIAFILFLLMPIKFYPAAI